MKKKIAVLAAAGLVLPACGALMKHMVEASEHKADNPLVSGQPLEARAKGHIMGSADDCSIWPFEDVTTVRATEAEICVSVVQNQEAPPGWSGEPTSDSTDIVSVSTDTAPNGIESIMAEKKGASKVGTCFNRGYNEQIAIWSFRYEGCTPNGGALTAATTTLRVGSESWRFPGAGAGAGAGEEKTAAK